MNRSWALLGMITKQRDTIGDTRDDSGRDTGKERREREKGKREGNRVSCHLDTPHSFPPIMFHITYRLIRF